MTLEPAILHEEDQALAARRAIPFAHEECAARLLPLVERRRDGLDALRQVMRAELVALFDALTLEGTERDGCSA